MKIVPVPRTITVSSDIAGHVRAAGRARAHDDGDLRDSERGQASLVEEDPAEVVAVGEDLRLEREERAARVDEVEARQTVLPRDLLCAEMLLHGERVVRAAFHRRVVGDDHALPALDDADPGDDPGRRCVAVVQVPRGERVQLEERGTRVDEAVDPFTCGELSARSMPLDRFLAASRRDECRALAKLGDELLHPRTPQLERLVADELGREDRHGPSLSLSA